MIDIKFSEFPKTTESKNTDEIAILQDGVNKMIPSPILESKIINRTVSELSKDGGVSLNIVNPKAVVPTYADLALLTNLQINDAYQVATNGLVYVWNGTNFQPDGQGFKIQPDVNGVLEEGNTNAVSGGEVYDKISEFAIFPVNLWNGNFESGYYNSSTGGPSSSVNWIRTPYIIVPNELKGKTLYIDGFGNASGGSYRYVIYDSSNVLIGSLVSSASNVSPISFEMPINAYKIGFTVAQDSSDGGIGTRPNNNTYVSSFSLTLGTETVNKIVLKSDSLDYNVKQKDLDNENNINLLKNNFNSVTVTSKNLFNTKTEVEAGSYQSDGTTSSTLNAIRTVKKNIPIELIGQQCTVSGGGALPTSRAIVTFWDSSNNIVSNIPSATTSNPFPLTFIVPLTAIKWGFTIANDASDGGIGTRPTDNIYTNTFQVEEGEQATTPIPLGDVYLDGSKIINTNGESNFDTNEIVLIKNSNTSITIYFHCGGVNNIWFRTLFFRQTDAVRFIDTWRLNEGYMVRRNSDASFSDITQIIRTGVWENAMYTNGAGYTDALGSAHGWEELESFSILIDSKIIDSNTPNGILRGNYMQMTQRSNFKTSNGISNIGTSMKIWEIKNGVIKVNNMIKWIGTLELLQNTYLSMLSILRRNAQNELITHTAESNEELIPYDVSEEGFITPIYSNGTDPNRTNIIIWGDNVKAEMIVNKRVIKLANGTVLNYGLPNAGMNVQNNELYNKLYGRFGSTTVQNGDIWEVETIYKISL